MASVTVKVHGVPRREIQRVVAIGMTAITS
jgi:hypothetical protein